MLKEIFYNNDKAYVVLRKIKMSDCNPKIYDIDSTNWKLVLKAWQEWTGANHILKVGETFLLCETIEEAKIINT